jgi:hypothetical protein
MFPLISAKQLLFVSGLLPQIAYFRSLIPDFSNQFGEKQNFFTSEIFAASLVFFNTYIFAILQLGKMI